MTKRTCDCPHPYPVCACAEGHRGRALLDRSKFASSLAGWPGPLDRPPSVARAEKPRVPLGEKHCKPCP